MPSTGLYYNIWWETRSDITTMQLVFAIIKMHVRTQIVTTTDASLRVVKFFAAKTFNRSHAMYIRRKLFILSEITPLEHFAQLPSDGSGKWRNVLTLSSIRSWVNIAAWQKVISDHWERKYITMITPYATSVWRKFICIIANNVIMISEPLLSYKILNDVETAANINFFQHIWLSLNTAQLAIHPVTSKEGLFWFVTWKTYP